MPAALNDSSVYLGGKIKLKLFSQKKKFDKEGTVRVSLHTGFYLMSTSRF